MTSMNVSNSAALDRRVGGPEGGAQHLAQILVRLEQVYGFEQPARQVDLVLVGCGQDRRIGLDLPWSCR